MALNPIGSSITISSSTLIVEALTCQTLYEPFDRLEFNFAKLRDVKVTTTGEKRLIGENLTGKPFQIVYGCSDQTAVQLIPLTEAAFDQVKRRFKIKRFNITGAFSSASAVNSLFTLASTHQNFLAEFQGYQARAGGDIGYSDLVALQSQTFNYLTTTGVSMSGTALDTSETNMLITQMSAETVLSIPTSTPGVNEFYKTFNITIENRTIQALRA